MKEKCRIIKQIVCLILVLVTGTMFSCGFFDVEEMPENVIPTDNNGSSNIKTPAKGGFITIASTKYDTFDPFFTNNYYTKEMLNLVYNGLTELESNMKAVPKLAETLEPSADGMTWTINLKQDVLWHDGKHFSAEDVKYTVDYIKANQQNRYYDYVSNLEIEVSGAYTLKIKCAKPDSFLPEKLYFPIIQKDSDPKTTMTGTGAFKLKEYNENTIQLVTYNNNNLIFNIEAPYIDGVFIRMYETQKEVLFSDCDLILVKYDDYNKIEGKIGYSTKKYITPEFEAVAINTAHDILSSSSVRRAISYGYNKKNAIEDISYSKNIIMDMPVFSELWLSPINNINYTYNKEEALKLLERSNHKDINVNCIVNKNNSERMKYAETLKNDLKEIGIEIQIEALEEEIFVQRITAKEYDIAFIGMNISMPDDLKVFYGTNAANNITGYTNTDLDKLFSDLDMNIFDKERTDIFSDIKNMILADMPYIGLFYKQDFIFYSEKLYGIEGAKPNFLKKFSGIEKLYTAEAANEV